MSMLVSLKFSAKTLEMIRMFEKAVMIEKRKNTQAVKAGLGSSGVWQIRFAHRHKVLRAGNLKFSNSLKKFEFSKSSRSSNYPTLSESTPYVNQRKGDTLDQRAVSLLYQIVGKELMWLWWVSGGTQLQSTGALVGVFASNGMSG
eukprot:1155546-Pelagomonas_calceolata.AAC.6